MHPNITIGITCHNASDTIARAVESALAQDWPALEVVAVDDCSSDGSWEILTDLAAREPRLRIVRHDLNKGYPAALNTILEHASGEFVAIFDDDDDNVADRLKAQVERIKAYEAESGAELVLCYTNRAVVKNGQDTPDHIAQAIGRAGPEPHGPEVADYILGIGASPDRVWGMFGSCTLMARKSTFATIGPFDADFRRCAEWDMAIRGAQMGAHFIAVNRPLITQYKTQSADKSGTKPLHYALMLRDKHRDYLNGKGVYLASKMFARSNFWGNKKQKLKSRFYRALGYALAPRLIPSYLKRRSGGVV
ncbi:glycosyltransferase [Devosia sp. XJ19-1]|uniref:Glycosyltransferase n=1 Tax=Devosia ureilytica TaxID=2952754 RepID=A0A9Q4AKW2_9HYPH|nr:glycosyltransferase [Devosia ureilytica]MCP8882616.1 glycosyltransferase [Devosia ureilytica]MCP8885497.1 glycosyltransferase [Devosia ureilytica]